MMFKDNLVRIAAATERTRITRVRCKYEWNQFDEMLMRAQWANDIKMAKAARAERWWKRIFG